MIVLCTPPLYGIACVSITVKIMYHLFHTSYVYDLYRTFEIYHRFHYNICITYSILFLCMICIGHLKLITDFKHNVNVIFLLLFLPYEMWLYPLHEIDDNVYRKSDDFKGK